MPKWEGKSWVHGVRLTAHGKGKLKSESSGGFDILRFAFPWFDTAESFDPELTTEGLVAGCGSLLNQVRQSSPWGWG
jgi:hypothetical protein